MSQPPVQLLPLSELSPQDRFDALYVSSIEITKRLGISRATLLQARRAGQMPGFIFVNGNDIVVWERAAVEPYLLAWEAQRAARGARQALVATAAQARTA